MNVKTFENTATLISDAYQVRTITEDGVVMFSSTDILKCCGMKAPGKWMERYRQTHPDEDLEHRIFTPIRTTKGIRRVKMSFINAETARKLIEHTLCEEKVRKWLLTEVLPYGASEPQEAVPDAQDPEADAGDEEKVDPVGLSLKEINRKIDKVLIELVELKKMALMLA